MTIVVVQLAAAAGMGAIVGAAVGAFACLVALVYGQRLAQREHRRRLQLLDAEHAERWRALEATPVREGGFKLEVECEAAPATVPTFARQPSDG